MTGSAEELNREDPLVRSGRREAIIVAIVWLIAMIYTVGYCYRFGYYRAPDELNMVFGIPDWVLWGIFAPWGACYVFSLAFSYGVMRDSDLGADGDSENGDATDD